MRLWRRRGILRDTAGLNTQTTRLRARIAREAGISRSALQGKAVPDESEGRVGALKSMASKIKLKEGSNYFVADPHGVGCVKRIPLVCYYRGFHPDDKGRGFWHWFEIVGDPAFAYSLTDKMVVALVEPYSGARNATIAKEAEYYYKHLKGGERRLGSKARDVAPASARLRPSWFREQIGGSFHLSNKSFG